MGVNNIHIGSRMVWNSNTAPVKTEKIEISNAKKPANTDKLVLNLPTAETVCKRREFVTDERMGEGCAFCYTYMERTLTFESEKYGISTASGSREDGYFLINLDKTAQTFGKSGAAMNQIEHAVEETRERKDRALAQSTISGSLSGAITGNGQTVGGSVGFAVQNTIYRYLSASETKGTVAYKNGGVVNYRETAMSSREIYNQCAVFLAEAFGEKRSEFVLDERAFHKLFGKLDGDEQTSSENAAQKREDLDKELSRLKEFVEKKLTAVQQKNPDCGSLQTFADTYLKLGAYQYSDITSLAEKMFAAENAAGTKK